MDRVKLQELLETVLGLSNVYFQPPASIQMKYPAIVYNLSDMPRQYANNKAYMGKNRYTVTLIHKNPDNTIKDDMLLVPYCKLVNCLHSDGLYNYVFDLYY